MRNPAEKILIAVVAVFAATGVTAVTFLDGPGDLFPPKPGPVPAGVVGQPTTAVTAEGWFSGVRQYCNPVEVQTRLRMQPPPAGESGAMYEAACYALAGKVDEARRVIDGLPEGRRYQAAGIVFEAGHPAADAGDDIAAGPLMELVVDYWPNHYMALYHAGAARFESGDHAGAKPLLERFLVEYRTEDGWRSSGERMLAEISKK